MGKPPRRKGHKRRFNEESALICQADGKRSVVLFAALAERFQGFLEFLDVIIVLFSVLNDFILAEFAHIVELACRQDMLIICADAQSRYLIRHLVFLGP